MECPVLVTMFLLLSCVARVASRNCPDNPVCFTETCVSAARELLDSMDNSTDPCEDFYKYACGGWHAQQFLTRNSDKKTTIFNIKPYAAARKMLSENPQSTDLHAEKKAKALYASCINHTPGPTEDTAIVRAVTDMFGRWPLTCKDCNVTGFDLETFLIKAVLHGVHPLFSLQANPLIVSTTRGEKTGRSHLHITHPSLGLSMTHYASLKTKPAYREIYADKIYADAKRFGIDDHDTSKLDAMEIVKVEERLAKLYNEVQAANSHVEYKLQSLDETFGKLLNWTKFVSTLGSSPGIGLTDITVNESVWVSDPAYLSNMTAYFRHLPERTQANYIIWRFVDSLQSELLDDKISYIFEHVFHLVLHRLLYGAHLPPDKLHQVKSMIHQLQQEFIIIAREHPWVDDGTMNFIEEKIETMATVISYFNAAMNASFVEAYYSNVTIDETNFINNVIEMKKVDFARGFRSTREVKIVETANLPLKPVAHNFLKLNQIEISSTFLQPPWFIDNSPKSINYAGFGFAFAHEILHAFDNTGRMYHTNLSRGEWWDKETVTKFQDRYKCLIHQYNKYVYILAGKKVNGTLTLGENIADNGGLKLAYRVYQHYTSSTERAEPQLPGVDLSNEKVFFLRYAQLWCTAESKDRSRSTIKNDPHSPGEFRVIGALQNSHDFARVFNCPVGSRMNPVKKCEVW